MAAEPFTARKSVGDAAILDVGVVIPRRIIHPQPHEPAEQCVVAGFRAAAPSTGHSHTS